MILKSSVVFLLGGKMFNAMQYNDDWEINIPQFHNDVQIIKYFSTGIFEHIDMNMP